MKKLLQIDFSFAGPFGGEMTTALNDLAISINQEPGFIWKIWTESKDLNEAGGIYLFENEATATAYLDKHTERLTDMGITEIRARIYDVNTALSQITKASIVN